MAACHHKTAMMSGIKAFPSSPSPAKSSRGHHKARIMRSDLRPRSPTPQRSLSQHNFTDRPVALTRRFVLASEVVGALIISPFHQAHAEDRNSQDLITNRVAMDIAFCPDGFNQQRGLGESSVCKEPQPLGRIVIGLYGHRVPVTVSNFLAIVDSGVYNGTLFHKVLPGKYIQAGKQGLPRLGGVAIKEVLDRNPEVTSSSAFQMQHFYPGTVSFALSANDDDDRIRLSTKYRNAEFLITTGPGPVPDLDGGNIVFGRVIEGMDTISRISEVPIFSPSEKLQVLNSLAKAVGDDRAAKARSSWGKPIQPVIISSAVILHEG